MGVFSLYWAGLQLSASLIPLDVYAQTTRLILTKRGEAGSNLERHFGFLLLAVFLLGPLALFLNVIFGAELDGLLLLIFAIHLPLEVYATDLSRLLIPLGKPLLSIISNFVRSAAWFFPVLMFFELEIAEALPVAVVTFWLSGTFLSVILILKFSRVEGLKYRKVLIDIDWIKAAITGSFVFLIATLMFRSILGVDKFLVSSAYGEDIVAIYTVYASGVLGVLAMLESGVSAWHYPRMVQSIKNNKIDLALRQFRSFFVQNFIATATLFLGLFLLFPLIAHAFLPPIYYDEISLFFIMAVGVVFYCLTMPFHYFLYGLGRDRYFLFMYSFSLALMFCWYFSIMRDFGINGAGLMLAGALISISIFRVMLTTRIILKRS